MKTAKLSVWLDVTMSTDANEDVAADLVQRLVVRRLNESLHDMTVVSASVQVEEVHHHG